MNEKLLNMSSSPHVRHSLTTGSVMTDVVLALLPATVFGVYRYGLHAFLVILISVASAVLAEYLFDLIAKHPNTIRDGSAVVTGLLLALSLSPTVPLYIPCIGSIFAILFVKCFFGGLGRNFMNPALTGRCFLLISFGSAMTDFHIDGVSSATPIAALKAGEAVDIAAEFLGFAPSVIGGSALALLIGGIFLCITGGITFEIPLSFIVVFTAFMGLFGGNGFDPVYLFAQICGGGILMGAFFMATDPVTSPVTRKGQLLFGGIVGLLSGLFRVLGSSADSVSYAIIISNMFVPFIDRFCVPKPLGYRQSSPSGKKEFPKAAVNLTIITLCAGLALSSVYLLTKDKIAEQELAASAASYQEVCPDAVSFSHDDTIDASVSALDGAIYDEAFGKTYVNDVVIGKDASDTTVGYVISVSSGDGYDGTITLSVGIDTTGTVLGISFTELHETAGMGMLCGEDAFKSQFNGVNTDAFVLNKTGGSTADNEIDSVSGASTSSGAVVNAVNTALAFYAASIK